MSAIVIRHSCKFKAHKTEVAGTVRLQTYPKKRYLYLSQEEKRIAIARDLAGLRSEMLLLEDRIQAEAGRRKGASLSRCLCLRPLRNT